MVGLGLVSVYELIRGSVSAYPALCIRALEALLDILQGQQPDALRNEPQEVIGECHVLNYVRFNYNLHKIYCCNCSYSTFLYFQYSMVFFPDDMK